MGPPQNARKQSVVKKAGSVVKQEWTGHEHNKENHFNHVFWWLPITDYHLPNLRHNMVSDSIPFSWPKWLVQGEHKTQPELTKSFLPLEVSNLELEETLAS